MVGAEEAEGAEEVSRRDHRGAEIAEDGLRGHDGPLDLPPKAAPAWETLA